MQSIATEGYRLSPQQRHLWLLQQSGGRAYRVQGAVLIEGRLDLLRLKTALERVVAQHEILRTAFHFLPEMTLAVQAIIDCSLDVDGDCDLSGRDVREKEAQVEALYAEMARHSFNYEQGPFLRAAVIRLSSEKHVLLLTLPALCADAVALQNLVREIARRYSPQPEEQIAEPLQYADFSEWLNELLEAEEAEPGRTYWAQQSLIPALALRLPFENRRSGEGRFETQFLTMPIEVSTSTKIRSLTREYHVSASVFLLVCWSILIWRLTQQGDITVGVANDGRRYEELAEALGLFAKYLPVRCHLEAGSLFADNLEKVSAAVRESQKWPECFSAEQFAAATSENGSQAAFFPLSFDYLERVAPTLAGPISFSIYKQHHVIDRFKLKLSVMENTESFVTQIHYDTNLFEPRSIKCLADQFHALLSSASAHPEGSIDDLEIVSDDERRQLLFEFNRTSISYDNEQCLNQLFEEQVRRVPHNVAMVFEEQQITYAELNARVNQLAHHLQGLGVGPEVQVAICVERSIDMIVGLLGILKAGGAYVPLDHSLPKARLAFMLADARVHVLLTQSHLRGTLPAHQAQVVCLDADWEGIAQQPQENPVSRAKAENLAYVIYTSGSTGKPKGVGVEHRQVSNYVHGVVKALELENVSSFAAISSFAADLGNTTIFPSLLRGGCLHLISPERAADSDALAEYFRRHAVECLKIVPTHFAALFANSQAEDLIPRRRLIFGGEVCHWRLVEALERVNSDCVVFNHYGPTETTIGALTYRLEKGSGDRLSATLPLGRPISNLRVYVLDSRLKPAPRYAVGEIYIGGAGVSRGYLNRPALTAERFVPDPFSEDSGRRLYRTGDYARHLPDGNIEFVGRRDHQVKIRGYRIELGEIEAVLAENPAIREAVVLSHDEAPEGQRLVAYVVASADAAPSERDLHACLKQKLPDYMIPADFIMLESFPLTSNGKLDRGALALAGQSVSKRAPYAPPRNEMENALTSIWQKVLDRSPIGIHDNFFSLGGDSIRVIQIAYEAKKYDLQIRALDVLQNPTVFQLAGHLHGGRFEEYSTKPSLNLIKLPEHILQALPDDVEDAYPVSGMQLFILSHYANDRQRMGVYHIQHAYHLVDESLSVSALKTALELLIKKHATLRTVFFVDGEFEIPIQAVKKSIACRVEEEDIDHLSFAEQEEYIEAFLIQDRTNLFDVGKHDEPLLRFKIFRRSAKSIEFVMSVHHAITDGWGNIELERELGELYLRIKNGDRPAAIHSANVYAEFIALEQEMIASQSAADFWKNQLKAAHYRPLRRRSSTRDNVPESNQMLTLDMDLSTDLHRLGRELGISLKAIFLSAYLDLIGMRQKQDAATVGVVSNGRSERLSDALKAVGLYWNIVPFCCRLDLDDHLSQLRTVQKQLVEIERYAAYPLTRIMEEQRKRKLFFASFNFIHFHNAKEIVQLTGMEILGYRSHDKFHFPLNYIVSVNPAGTDVSLRVEYDKLYFSGKSIESLSGDYIKLLADFASLRAKE